MIYKGSRLHGVFVLQLWHFGEAFGQVYDVRVAVNPDGIMPTLRGMLEGIVFVSWGIYGRYVYMVCTGSRHTYIEVYREKIL